MEVRILDPNIVSYLMNGHTNAEAYRPHMLGRQLAISFMTVAEIYEGAYRKGWDAKKFADIELDLRKYVVIPHSTALCQLWGEIRAQRKRQPIAVDDAWIAACADGYGYALVTHNPDDFQGIAGLKIVTEHSA